MSMQRVINPQFDVRVQVRYAEKDSRPEKGQYLFIYSVTITNNSPVPAQLMSRHWIITDSTGNTEEVEGQGVVGTQPKIGANQSFHYESGCPLPTSTGSMHGFYQMIAEDGDSFEIEIPEFYLIAPQALH